MAQNPTRLYVGVPASGSGIIYTVPAGKTVIVKQIVVCNTNAATTAVAGLTLAGANVLYMPLPGQSSQILDLSQVLTVGDSIAWSLTGTGVHLIISGVVSP